MSPKRFAPRFFFGAARGPAAIESSRESAEHSFGRVWSQLVTCRRTHRNDKGNAHSTPDDGHFDTVICMHTCTSGSALLSSAARSSWTPTPAYTVHHTTTSARLSWPPTRYPLPPFNAASTGSSNGRAAAALGRFASGGARLVSSFWSHASISFAACVGAGAGLRLGWYEKGAVVC